MSGQAVNFHKSSVCFSKNTAEVDREAVVSVLGVTQAPNFGKYLGFPSFIGREKRAVFSYIEDKIRQRIGSWIKRLMSQACKEVLLKSVAQSMPTFSMSVFLLPDSVCVSIERAMNRYWWGSGSERGIHWKACDRLCIPKKYGGLGFKELRAFNLTMLGKQAWRFLTRPNSLVAKIYKARYFPRSSFINASMGSCPSFCWRSIMAAHELICSGVRRRVGNGTTTLIWGHPWLPDESRSMIQIEMPPQLEGSLVAGLIDPATNTWDQEILQDIFSPSDIERILRIPISPTYEDTWFWYGNPTGCYTVKDGYRSIVGEFVDSPGVFNNWLHFWKIKAPPKWKTFVWRAISNIIPTTTNLILKRVDIDPTCPMCGLDHENTMHSLILCDFARLVWHESSLPIHNVVGHNFCMWFSSAMHVLTDGDLLVVMAVLYQLWKARNGAVWDRLLLRPKTVWMKARIAAETWRQLRSSSIPVLEQASPAVIANAAVSPLPAAQSVRCFFDAGFQPASKRATMGAVLLSPDGLFLAGRSGPLSDCYSPLMAESMACKEELSWIKDRGVSSVDLYTDCSTLQSLLNSNQSNIYSYVAFSIDVSKAILSSFISCSVNLVTRTANQVAHTLATAAFSQASSLYWILSHQTLFQL